MRQYQCARFHLYNAPEGDSGGCPVCAAQDAELAKTRGLWEGDRESDPSAGQNPDPDLTLEPGQAAPLSSSDKKTIGAYAHLGVAVEPVVGWLACIDGPDKGRDWRLVSGRNTIGRGDGSPVRLAADPAVSRERHAVLSFDPRRAVFTLAPGDGHGLIYRNGVEVLMPVTMDAFDRIELGGSTLLFVPLVGDRFTWSEGQ